eukprot:TRINITY_DN40878_c0_g1_i1.p1 TRINITY_DN40878_c0_g1~~TRINITY_DN40878_c0_g1_i1.p1  ORF type:complete len:385 (+),score=25.08 TRINITY_DN40878_c0_g1_i1:64-1155(+)
MAGGNRRERKPPERVHRTLKQHLAQFICLTNHLQPFYPVLKENALPVRTIRDIVARCNFSSGVDVPALSADSSFLSRFLLRQCESYKGPPGADAEQEIRELSEVEQKLADIGVEFSLNRPSHLILNETQLSHTVPRWLWDARLHGRFEDYPPIVQMMPGHADELRNWPIFAQGQDIQRGHDPVWRQQRHEWEHTLFDTLQYRPGSLWVEPEIWLQAKGRVTRFHYDYDPHSLLFQVSGSRRIHILPPESRQLKWEPFENLYTRPSDYGTRWAEPLSETIDQVIDLGPHQILKIPNGWPHRVTYHEDSIGYAVRSWTQCQALATWLGQRLCVLSSMVGSIRICFDDEDHRESSHYRAMESEASS